MRDYAPKKKGKQNLKKGKGAGNLEWEFYGKMYLLSTVQLAYSGRPVRRG